MIEIKSLASGSSGNCYRISDGNSALLLEAGIKFKDIRKALDFKLSQISGCLISHSHSDHCKAVFDLMKAGVDIFLSLGAFKFLTPSGHRFHIVESGKQFTIESWTILPFDTVHDAPEPLGFLLASGESKILYATDTSYLKYRFKGLTHIMVETNYSIELLKENKNLASVVKQQIMKNHMSLETATEFLKANDLSKVQQIHLLHLSDAHSDAALFKYEIQMLTGKEVYIAPKRRPEPTLAH